jgi:N-methylhydantoinase A/oxoprolinase/acetone carboxylase beta subunit
VEVVNWRLTAIGPPGAAPELVQSEAPRPERPSWRRLHLWQDEQEVLVMRRSALRAHGRIAGPALLEEPVTTLVVPPGWSAEVGELDCVIARKG